MYAKNRGIILRENLIRIFQKLANERIVFVCAPAGYGKTVAVRQWLEGDPRAKAGISLDEYDNNPAGFCERFCTALSVCQPQNPTLSEIISHPSFAGAPEEFTLRALCALSERQPAILVIDDLHFIHNKRVLHLLPVFIKRLPELFQILLISRTELPPGFSELLSDAAPVCITAGQLRFNREEIIMLYEKRGNPVTPELAEDIYRFTDGWAIGINALLLSGGEPTGKSLDYLESFIRSDIWDKWDDETREFLLNTAEARNLNPELCAALTGVADSEKLLNRLMQSGAFILQTKDGEYRYHHLFHNFLKNMLSERGEDYLFVLLEKEGKWYFSQRNYYNAIERFIRCDNIDGIENCMNLLSIHNRNDFLIERLLPVIQSRTFIKSADKYPYMYSIIAWAAFAEGRAGDMMSNADKFYARYPEIMQSDPSHAHYIFLMYFIDFRVSLRDLGNAAAALPVAPAPKGAEASASMNMPLLHRSTREFSELALGDIEENVGRMRELMGWLFGEEIGLLAESLAAGLLYEQGHLDKAHSHAIAANAEIKEHFPPESKFCAMSVLIYILDALGRLREAEDVLNELIKSIEHDRAYYLNRNLDALITRRRLANGDINAAHGRLTEHAGVLHNNLSFYEIYQTFTTCRALITGGSYDTAIILLKKVLELASSYRRPADITEAYILLSIACRKKKHGFRKEAVRYLENAVTAAYPFGYTQMFVNEAAELSDMIYQLLEHAGQPSRDSEESAGFIKMLCLKMPEIQNTEPTNRRTDCPLRFTDRQKTVMKLLCDGKSYKEITESMGIKLPTLRSHIALIYKKLDVTNETDASIKIKALGLLEEI